MKQSRRVKASEKWLKEIENIPVREWDPAVVASYERKEFGHGWRDTDSDGQDERHECLIRWHRTRGWKKAGLAEEPKLVLTDDGKRVISGRWICRFTGDTFTLSSKLDIDHLVPLKAAWISGANEWDKDKRVNYSNGFGVKSKMRTWLVPVYASANRSKGAKGPEEWLPPRERYHLFYAVAWLHAKKYWGLSITAAEKAALITCLKKVDIAP